MKWTIGKKLTVGSVFLLVLLVLVFLLGLQTSNQIMEDYEKKIIAALSINGKTKNLNIEILQIRRLEKDFLMQHQTQYAENALEHTTRAVALAQEIEQSTQNAQMKQFAQQAQQEGWSYAKNFQLLQAAIEAKGIDETLGAQGRLRHIAHRVGEAAEKQDVATIYIHFLQIRRYEKDYHRVGTPQYLKKHQKAIENFSNSVQQSSIEQKMKDQLKQALANYKTMWRNYLKVKRNSSAGLQRYEQVRGKAAKAIGDLVLSRYIQDGSKLYLTLRRNEKDFMQRLNPKYLKRLTETIELFKQNIEQSSIAPETKKSLQQYLGDYKLALMFWSEKDQELKKLTAIAQQNSDNILQLTHQMEHLQNQLVEESRQAIQEEATARQLLMLLFAIFALFIGIGGALFLIRNLVFAIRHVVDMAQNIANGDLQQSYISMNRNDEIGDLILAFQIMNTVLHNTMMQVSSSANQVSNRAQQLSSSSQALAKGANDEANSLEKITLSITELLSQTEKNSQSAQQASQLSLITRQNAQEGNAQMKEMTNAMENIENSSQNISKIIQVIDEIAFQTNLLALNAAVEAARAGIHGKGFAVVASEVRNLAIRSADAAKETSELIANSVQQVAQGMEVSQKTANALQKIVENVSKVTDLIEEINSVSMEQALKIKLINQGTQQIKQLTHQNTTYAEKEATTAKELTSQSTQLQQILSQFQLETDEPKAIFPLENNPKAPEESSKQIDFHRE